MAQAPDFSQLGINAFRTETGRLIIKTPTHRGVFQITDPNSLPTGLNIQNVKESELGKFIGGVSSDSLSSSQFFNRILPEVEGTFRSQQLQGQQQQQADIINQFQASKKGIKGIFELPETVDATQRQQFVIKDGILTSRSSITAQEKEEADFAAGLTERVRVGSGFAYIPKGSAASKNQLGVQQPQTFKQGVFKVGDKYLNEQGQLLGTEQDIRNARGVSANLPDWAKGSVTSIPIQTETSKGGVLAPNLNQAAQAAGISEDQVRSLYSAAGFSGFTQQTPEQFSQQIFQTDRNLQTQPTTTQAGIQPTQPQSQFGPSSYTGVSIVDYLNSVGQDASFTARKQLATTQGIQNYTGTAQQNTQLLNQLRSQQIQPGTSTGGVSAPGATTLPPVGTQPQQEQQSQTYTVKSGDTLSQIAAQLGVNWKTDITGFKSGDPDLIFPGEVLTIKKAFTPTPSTDLPPPEPKDTDVGGAGDTTPPPPEQTNPLTPGEEDYSKVLQQRSYDDYVDSFAKRLGLDDLKKQLGDLNLALEAAKQKGINRRNDINNNPWISEELRGRKIANADKASKEEEALALEQFDLVQKQYNNAREEIKFAAKMAVDQQNEDREFYFKVKEASRKARESTLKEGLTTAQIEATEALTTQRLAGAGAAEALAKQRLDKIGAPEVTKPSTQILNIDGKKYLVDKTTGNIIKQIKPGEEVPPSPPTPITPTIPTGKQVIETRKPGLIAKKPGFLSRIKQFFKGKKKRTKITKTQSAISPANAISWDDF